MSNLDIDTINNELFYSRRNICLESDTDVDIMQGIMKLRDIFKKYSCFREELNHHVFKQTQSSNKTFHKHNVINSSSRVAKRTKSLSYMERIKRETIAILNKLSESNFNTVTEKFMRYCEDGNVTMLVSMIVEKAYLQDCYIHLFIKLLQKIGEKHKDNVIEGLNKFVQDYIDNIHNELDNICKIDHAASYDDFCLFMLHKNIMFKKNKLVLEVCSTFKIVHDQLMKKYINEIDEFSKKSNSDIIDIIVQLLVNTSKYEHIDDHVVNALTELYNVPCLTMKSKFMIQDCLDKVFCNK